MDIFYQANDFRLAAHALHVQKQFAVPAIVNGAFAIELYLKALGAVPNDPADFAPDALAQEPGDAPAIPPGRDDSHHIGKLFASLHVHLRDGIRQAYAPAGVDPDTLERDLATFNLAFDDWRYLYEKHTGPKAIEIARLFQLADFLDGFCRSRI